LAAGAYEVLVQAIVTGTLAPGARIRDGELAAQLPISRMPVREAHTAAELVEANYLRLGEQMAAILEPGD
jgi:DNA-binding FadR family transcriptional regulator